MIIWYSNHAREQMISRGISPQEIREAIQSGTKHIQDGEKIVAAYRYFAVVYKVIEKDNYFIITVKPR